jgi:homoserine O-succinyltransferase/O-acetyltransferase
MPHRQRPLKICLIDMNDGHANQAMRCLRSIIERFVGMVYAKNPGLPFFLSHISPRDLGHEPPRDADLYLSTGGPGSPFDGDGAPWLEDYYRFLDDLTRTAAAFPNKAPSLFGVCYSFELLVRHFGVAKLAPRPTTKFGVMPIYTTEAGRHHPLTQAFQDRLFAFEHRNWEVIDLDEKKLLSLGGHVLARESRDGHSKGKALLAFDFGPGIEGVQFHPEADRAGVVSWIRKVEHAEAFQRAYGEATFKAMLRTLDNPGRIARTFDTFVPGWMIRRFNIIADDRGWNKVDTLPDPVSSHTAHPHQHHAHTPTH